MSKDMLGTLVRKLVTLPSSTLGSLCDFLDKNVLTDPEWQKEFQRFLRKESCWVPAKPKRPASVVHQWQDFYAKYFPELEVDFSTVVIPTREGFNRTIIVAEGLTLNKLFEVCKSKFPSWRSHEDLDLAVPTNERHPNNGSYAIICRDSVEADEELANTSAETLNTRSTKTLTLLERMLFELKYFDECGGYLDVTNVTLCAGSRSADGRVPSAGWGGGKFYVSANYCSVRDASPDLWAREAGFVS